MIMKQVFVNADEGLAFEKRIFELEPEDTRSVLNIYRRLNRAFGRCKGRKFHSGSRSTKQVGWIFYKNIKDIEVPFKQEAHIEIVPETGEGVGYFRMRLLS
jgi:hypothetical protein